MKRKYKTVYEDFLKDNEDFLNKYSTCGTEGLSEHLIEICLRCQRKRKDELMAKMYLNSFLIRIFCMRDSFEEIVNSLNI